MNLPALHSLQFSSPQPGPRLIILGAVHGNETCGTEALLRLHNELQTGALQLRRGLLTLVPVCNPLAFARGQRCGDRNLNRRLLPTPQPQEYEDHIANWLCPLLAQHEVLLDLHSFHTAGEPFAMLGPLDNAGELEPFAHAREEERLARSLGVHRFVDGWLDTYARGVQRRQQAGVAAADSHSDYGVGTTEYMRRLGGYALTLECGQHTDASAPRLAYQAVRNTLAVLGMIEQPAPALLPARDAQVLRLYDVIDREQAGDSLQQEWRSFDHLPAGTLIGRRASGEELRTTEEAFIVFPNPGAAPGQEWFYLARPVQRFA